ncbi:MAG: FAD:protein FMN transferase [Waddliaceae bacterium]
MEYKIMVGQSHLSVDKNKIQAIIDNSFNRINQTFNSWNPESEISTFNRLKANEEIALSLELSQFFTFLSHIVPLTEGRFDPTIAPLKKSFIAQLEKGMLPDQNEQDTLSKAVGWDKIRQNETTVSKSHDLTSLDLGGIAKGYAIDLITDNLRAAGYKNLYVEWGGEIRAIGEHPLKRPWRIYIRHFESADPSQALALIDLKDRAVATSGDYLQHWSGPKGIQYTHIIDPKTRQPLKLSKNSISSATVLAETATLADALATTLMLFETEEEAKNWIETVRKEYPDIQYWIATRDS